MPALNKKSRGGNSKSEGGMFDSSPRCSRCKVVIPAGADNTCGACKTASSGGGAGSKNDSAQSNSRGM